MSEIDELLPSRRLHEPSGPKMTNASKSDVYIRHELSSADEKDQIHKVSTMSCCGEYYKKYEHDEEPNKDCNPTGTTGTGDNKCLYSLTNSQLVQLETEILKDIPNDLKPDNDSFSSLDSNTKFFKSTCEQIFKTFYATMQDIEVYKLKFQDIMEKNKADYDEMENFIKEMIQNIMSNDSFNESIADGQRGLLSSSEINVAKTASSTSNEFLESLDECYKNDSFESKPNDKTSKRTFTKSNETFNIYLLCNSPCLDIKIKERNMHSEINIKNPSLNIDTEIASAENLKKVATKKRQIEVYQCIDDSKEYSQDLEIPIKVSSAKKNLYLNEDFCVDQDKIEETFMSKICSFLCKKFRKCI